MHPTRGRPIPIRRCSRKSSEPAAASTPLVGGRIGAVAELASLEGISDRYEAVALVVI